jgi:hypothetical protein
MRMVVNKNQITPYNWARRLEMGGYHVIHRASSASTYIAVAGTLKLPNSCDCRSDSSTSVNDGVFPEFFFGFYKGNYGLDIGILYRGQGNSAKTFRLFCNGFANTVNNANHYVELSTGISKGATITLRSYLSGNNLLLTVDNRPEQISVPLKSEAVSAFMGGAKINRELTCASNTSYITSPAYFSDTTWSNTTMTDTSNRLRDWYSARIAGSRCCATNK